VALLYAAYLWMRDLFWWAAIKCVKKTGCCKIPKIWYQQPNVDEDIDRYEHVLDKDDRIYSISEELNMKLYGISTMMPE